MSELVSVVTAMYNAERFVESTIRSVQAQSYPHWEMLIVDDGSTDRSLEIAERYAASDPRIKVIACGANGGSAAARNAGIAAASGRFIAFLDSDDIWHPLKLEKQIAFMLANESCLSYTRYEHVTEDGARTGAVVIPPDAVTHADLLRRCHIGCLTAVYDTHKVGKVYMPDIRRRQDYGLWLRILRPGRQAHGIQETLAFYRVRQRSLSSNKYQLIWYHWKLYSTEEGLSRLGAAVLAARYALGAVQEKRAIRSRARDAQSRQLPRTEGPETDQAEADLATMDEEGAVVRA